MNVRIERLRIPSPDVERWCEIYTAGRAIDSGRRDRAADLAARINRRGDDADAGRFAAWQGERLVGVAEVGYPFDDGTGHAEGLARIYVDAARRRAGTGRALADAVIEWAAQHRCGRVKATVVAGTPGEAFARSLGMRVVLRLVTVIHDLDRPAPPVAVPAGVRLVRWTDGTPDELLDAYAVLRRAVGDAPEAHMQMDIAARTTRWVREWERLRTATGNELWISAAIDENSGDLVAFTEVEVPESGGADQHDTVVLPDARGRGIASWLKADMVDWLRADRPEVDSVTSTVNERNTPMLRVCAAVGYREVWRRHLVILDIAGAARPAAAS